MILKPTCFQLSKTVEKPKKINPVENQNHYPKTILLFKR